MNSFKQLTFEAIGTYWSVEVFGEQKITPELKTAIQARIELFDKAYSRFRPDSLVTAMAQTAGSYELPADAQPMLDLYHELYEMSQGAVTPLIGQALVDAGYDAGYSLEAKPLQPTPKWEEVLNYDFPELTLKRPALLDFGAIGKGYLVDIVADLLREYGHTAYFVDAGGDMIYHQPDNTPLEIGLEHPSDPTQAIAVVQLANQALCGSAGNRRAWAGYHHIIDPEKLASPGHMLAVWVTSGSTMLADGLTTALFFLSPEVLTTQYTFEYAIVYADYSFKRSAGFPAEFFSAEK